jgi:hypothetical protein
MSEMVERLARAIEAAVPNGIEPISHIAARAALQAMRQPSERITAEIERQLLAFRPGQSFPTAYAENLHIAVIDKALED